MSYQHVLTFETEFYISNNEEENVLVSFLIQKVGNTSILSL